MNLRMEPCVSGGEATRTPDIKFVVAKLQTPGTVDRQRDVVAQRAVSKGRGGCKVLV
jgi:hypothetical protein